MSDIKERLEAYRDTFSNEYDNTMGHQYAVEDGFDAIIPLLVDAYEALEKYSMKEFNRAESCDSKMRQGRDLRGAFESPAYKAIASIDKAISDE